MEKGKAEVKPAEIETKVRNAWEVLLIDGMLDKINVTRTSALGVAPIHFPPRSRFLPIPGRLCAHTHAIPILADCALPLPLLVILPLITFPLSLYYISLAGSSARFPLCLSILLVPILL
jgi:hypothetical protein